MINSNKGGKIKNNNEQKMTKKGFYSPAILTLLL